MDLNVKATAWRDNAAELPDDRNWPRNVFKHLGANDDVETRVGNRNGIRL